MWAARARGQHPHLLQQPSRLVHQARVSRNAGGSNVASGNQIASGNGKGGATDTTTAGNGGSITGRKMLGSESKPPPAPSSPTDVACSAGLVAVKFGRGIICVAGAGNALPLSSTCCLPGEEPAHLEWVLWVLMHMVLSPRPFCLLSTNKQVQTTHVTSVSGLLPPSE